MGDVNQSLDRSVNNITDLCNNMFDVLLNDTQVVSKSGYVQNADNYEIIGVGLGSKSVNDVYTGFPTLTYLVANKVALSQLSADQVIPPMKHGVATDVIEVGEISLLSSYFSNQQVVDVPSNNSSYNSMNNKNYFDNSNYFNRNYNNSYSNRNSYNGVLPQGGEKCICHNSNGFGTIGCLVKDDTNIYLLSNNHVLNNMGLTPSNYSIFNADNSNTPIASLSRYADIRFASSRSDYLTSNRIDAAIAKIGKISDLRNYAQSGILGINKINGTSHAKIGSTVQKIGAASGASTGKVILSNAAIKVKYNNKTAIFTGQTVTTTMAKHGDSGSLGLNANSSAFGLLFAGSNKISIYNPIDDVLNKLGVTIL